MQTVPGNVKIYNLMNGRISVSKRDSVGQTDGWTDDLEGFLPCKCYYDSMVITSDFFELR